MTKISPLRWHYEISGTVLWLVRRPLWCVLSLISDYTGLLTRFLYIQKFDDVLQQCMDSEIHRTKLGDAEIPGIYLSFFLKMIACTTKEKKGISFQYYLGINLFTKRFFNIAVLGGTWQFTALLIVHKLKWGTKHGAHDFTFLIYWEFLRSIERFAGRLGKNSILDSWRGQNFARGGKLMASFRRSTRIPVGTLCLAWGILLYRTKATLEKTRLVLVTHTKRETRCQEKLPHCRNAFFLLGFSWDTSPFSYVYFWSVNRQWPSEVIKS